jgi:hypothetical protein
VNWLQVWFETHARDLRTEAFKVENLFDNSKDLVMTASYTFGARCQMVGEKLVVNLPAVWEGVYLAVDEYKERENDFEIYYPVTVESESRCSLPEGYEPFEWNKLGGGSGGAPFAEWTMSSKVKDREVKVTYRCRTLPGRHPRTRYAEYRDKLQKAAAAPALQLQATPRK